MKYKVLILFLLLLCLSNSASTLFAQENQPVTSVILNGGKQSPGTYANIFLYYPLEKSSTPFSLFLNKKNIGKITNGGRIECKLLLEGPVAITLIEGFIYKEPLTQSRNSRTISITKGKSYYFRVNGNGALEYILSQEKGQNQFAESKEFITPPVSFIETESISIPSLQSKSN